MDRTADGNADRDLDRLIAEMSSLLEDAGIYVGAEIDGDTVVLSGEVDSTENRDAALDVARATVGRAGVRLVDAIDVMEIAPDSVFEPTTRLTTDNYWDAETAGAPQDPNRSPLELDPDFTDEPGTTDPQIAAAEGVPYYPPTDPVVRPSNDAEEIDILNGFATGSLDDAAIANAPRGDDEIADEVARLLQDDALTSELHIGVRVVDGVVFLGGEVPTLDDAENAEAVASNVAGVAEVREELRIASMRDRR